MEALKETYKTVDGKNPAPAEVGSLSHDLQGFFTSKWYFSSPTEGAGFLST